jgi:hypothetical protein
MKQLLPFLATLLCLALAAPAQKATVDAYEHLLQSAATWELTPETLETMFAKRRVQWADAEKTRAQILPYGGDQPSVFGGLRALEASVEMKEGHPSRVQILLYSRGDSGEIGKAQFEKLKTDAAAAIDKLAGKPGKPRAAAENKQGAVKVEGVVWEGAETFYLLESSASKTNARKEFLPEFLRLTAAPPPAKRAVGAASGTAKATTAKRASLVENVVKEDKGDVYVKDVPMVDQGQKGYCAVATTERVLRYYGLPVDQHELAQVAETRSGGGTSQSALYESLEKLRGKFRFQLKQIIPWDYGEFKKMIEKYNTHVRKKKLAVGPAIEPVSDLSITYESLNGEVLREVRATPQEVASFQKSVAQFVETGVPLVWSVNLSLLPETGLPQAGGGHMRLIIGYNTKTSEILYSDSWGPGHELKRMPTANAVTITTQLLAIRPSH